MTFTVCCFGFAAPRSGYAQHDGQRPNQGRSPVYFRSLPAGQSPASHQAAKPVEMTHKNFMNRFAAEAAKKPVEMTHKNFMNRFAAEAARKSVGMTHKDSM